MLLLITHSLEKRVIELNLDQQVAFNYYNQDRLIFLVKK